MPDLSSIIADLERQKTAIEGAIAALRGIGGTPIDADAAPAKRRGRPPGPLSAKERQHRREIMRRYWAEKGTGKKTAAKKATKKGGLTAEGRKRLSENLKKRWAEKRLGKKGR